MCGVYTLLNHKQVRNKTVPHLAVSSLLVFLSPSLSTFYLSQYSHILKSCTKKIKFPWVAYIKILGQKIKFPCLAQSNFCIQIFLISSPSLGGVDSPSQVVLPEVVPLSVTPPHPHQSDPRKFYAPMGGMTKTDCEIFHNQNARFVPSEIIHNVLSNLRQRYFCWHHCKKTRQSPIVTQSPHTL